jgi:hypothetical protein
MLSTLFTTLVVISVNTPAFMIAIVPVGVMYVSILVSTRMFTNSLKGMVVFFIYFIRYQIKLGQFIHINRIAILFSFI